MHLNSDIIKYTSYSVVNKVVNEVFKSLRSKYHKNLETSMIGSDFVFESIQLTYCKCHKVNFKRGGSCIDSPNWIKKKKATINPKNEDDKCFQWAASVALNFEKIESHPDRVSNIIPFINKCNWKKINYPPKIDDWKTIEKNYPTIALNILHTKEKEICPAYISNNNSTREKQVILLMTSNNEKER